jgi:hypothetical protein
MRYATETVIYKCVILRFKKVKKHFKEFDPNETKLEKSVRLLSGTQSKFYYYSVFRNFMSQQPKY